MPKVERSETPMDLDGLTGWSSRPASVARDAGAGTRTKLRLVAPEPTPFTTVRRGWRFVLRAIAKYTKRLLGR